MDVIAAFNTIVTIKPRYIRLEENHELCTCRIERICYTKEDRTAGTRRMEFVCMVERKECLQQIRLFYYLESNKWMIEEEEVCC